ncbi:adenine glycosylase [Aliivibrio sp. S2TY2]|uniref:baseplate complex protein n=1 Tax=unclassified Aliivibrio TaxID=2645654 RepID=UPI0023794BAC|nr:MULTISPECIES: adenine glycosylase [unclassified Aliivibrio]MDD9174509.1 adenine glycosylase [Aliivibrio sp. S3TY1]MDD9191587.1 adenine glycosylase [Aliivibrio sp. S2TY2]
MTLQLNQKTIRGEDIKTSIKLPFGDSDLSGLSSSTEMAETGTKAKVLTVTMVIPFQRKAWLTEIANFAEAVEQETGARVIYRIGHDAANAIKFYEGKFSGELSINEMDSIQGWQVGFSLHEHLSVPERKNQREEIKPAKQQGGGGDVAAKYDNPHLPPSTDLLRFETMFAYTNEKLGITTASNNENTEGVGVLLS